ncbi:MAG TPA: response regulator, partial [Clostridia bacterium]|nr:response regulator [Clostridia bacterium]
MSRILLIEDDAALRNSVRQILEHSGYEVRVAVDGSAGVRELQSAAFDVVLLDIGLPFVDGWQILQKMEGIRLPSVIVISARGEERDKVRALDMGADDY